MAWVAVAIGGMNAMNQIQQGRYANAQAGLQAQQLDYQAQVEQDTALKTAEIIRRAGRRQVGQANATYAAAGVKVGEGSALETERQIDQDVEHDAFQTILEGSRRAGGLRADAAMTRADGRAREAAGYVNAVGTALGSAYQGLKSSGWRTAGPGFSGTQAPAPVEIRNVPKG
jgi:hypothetical protein